MKTGKDGRKINESGEDSTTGLKNNMYFTVAGEAQGEIVEKKSRFICNLYHVETEEEIKETVDMLKKKHYQARHVCYAAILGDAADSYKYSDDGEPAGTAGRPMLDILKGKGLTYTLACVTRYFGGVLLGTGGLVRAYSDSLNAGLENADIIKKQICRKLRFSVDYQTIGRLKYILEDYEAKIISEDYGSEVDIKLSLPEGLSNGFICFMVELTGGKVNIEDLGVSFE